MLRDVWFVMSKCRFYTMRSVTEGDVSEKKVTRVVLRSGSKRIQDVLEKGGVYLKRIVFDEELDVFVIVD